jgi:hypothetical protein
MMMILLWKNKFKIPLNSPTKMRMKKKNPSWINYSENKKKKTQKTNFPDPTHLFQRKLHNKKKKKSRICKNKNTNKKRNQKGRKRR